MLFIVRSIIKYKNIKFIGLSLFIIIFVSMSAFANAIESVDVASEESLLIEQKIFNNSKATITDSTGKVSQLQILDVEVHQVNKANDSIMYTSTLKYKTNSDTLINNGIHVAGILTIEWFDGPGSNNRISGLQGAWTVSSGTFQYGQAGWGSHESLFSEFPPTRRAYVSNPFDISLNYTSINPAFGLLVTGSRATVKNASGNIFTLDIMVNPTIFD